MSVGTCPHLYQPEEAFDMNAFESWFHRSQWQYQHDEEPEQEKEVESDHVPDYPWLAAATAHMRAFIRPKTKSKPVKKVIPVPQSAPAFRLVPLPMKDLDYEDGDVDPFDDEETYIRLCLIETLRFLREVKGRQKSPTYKENLQYIREMHYFMRDWHHELDPPFIQAGLKLLSGFIKKD